MADAFYDLDVVQTTILQVTGFLPIQRSSSGSIKSTAGSPKRYLQSFVTKLFVLSLLVGTWFFAVIQTVDVAFRVSTASSQHSSVIAVLYYFPALMVNLRVALILSIFYAKRNTFIDVTRLVRKLINRETELKNRIWKKIRTLSVLLLLASLAFHIMWPLTIW